MEITPFGSTLVIVSECMEMLEQVERRVGSLPG